MSSLVTNTNSSTAQEIINWVTSADVYVHTADMTQLKSWVASAAPVCFGLNSRYWVRLLLIYARLEVKFRKKFRNSRIFACVKSPLNNVDAAERSDEQRRLVDAQKYQMMDLAVQPAHQDPLIVVENQRWILYTALPRRQQQQQQQQQLLLLLLLLVCRHTLWIIQFRSIVLRIIYISSGLVKKCTIISNVI